MFLNQLEMFGFKSFPAKLNLKFGEGITAIVGPNGCGKTNIVDAIRWVLGEQKPTLLRSEQMEDVIFNGTAQRKPLNMAEVSLTIDNTRSVLPNEYSEVMITRRLFRSGESEYLLNKTVCRRKDIVDLFLDTGMAPHAYSVIELPMVESILGGQADALRVLFEEASGIAKYKARRREAFRKLAKTQDNLLRLGDIVAEVEKAVRSLKRQAAAAQRHHRYAQELQQHELTLASSRYRQQMESKTRLAAELNEARTRDGDAQEHLKTQEERAKQLQEQLSDHEEQLSSLHLQLSQQDEAIHRLNEQMLVNGERKEGLSTQRARLQSEVKDLEERKLALGRERDERTVKKKELSEHLSAARKMLEERETKLSEVDGRLIEKRTALERLREKIGRLSERKSDIRQQLISLGGGRELWQQRAQDIAQELQRIDLRLEELTSSAGDLEKQLHHGEQEAAKLQGQLHQAQEDAARAATELEEMSERLQKHRGQMELHRSRLEALRSVMESYEGYQMGVKSVLTELAHLKGVIGTVADILETEERYVPAVEAALGEAAQYIVVQQRETALKAIEHLRTRQAGRATFLILEEAKRLAATTRSRKLLSRKGVLSWAPGVVSCIPQHRPAVEFLLGQVLIVERLKPHLFPPDEDGASQPTLVSLEGDVYHPPAFLQGGQLSEETGFLDRQMRLREEESALETLTRQVEQMEMECSQAKARAEEHADRAVRLEEALQSHRAQTEPTEKALQEGRLQSRLLLERRAALEAERKELARQNDAPEGPKERLTQKLSEIDSQLDEKRTRLHELEEEVRSLEQSSRTAMKASSEARVELASVEERHAQIGAEEGRWHQIETELRSTLSNRRKEIKDIAAQMTQLGRQIEQHGKEIHDLEARRQELQKTRQALQERATTLRDELQGLETNMKGERHRREEVQSEIHQLELQLAELEIRKQSLLEKIESEYEVDLKTFTSPPEDEEAAMDPAEREKRIHFLRNRLHAMGPVNMAALEEYQTQKERYDFLTAEREDLQKAEKNLNDVIADLNRRARSLFSETFRQVGDNFKEIFGQMFNGGEANLILNGKRDPLEADIQIFACPGGKKLRHIAQLSGGEKALTAISLLFALYQVKPSPFCVLDEVDAPLDDANIGRFVSMLKILSKKSQFIIITHNKNTMAAANVLYGVTMQQSGISQVVSVNLRQTGETDAVPLDPSRRGNRRR
jgi:chromosome segregation protein